MLNGQWVAQTNFKDQLTQISWEQANSKIGPHNTIAILTFHVDYYIGGLVDFFENGQLEIRDKFSFDAPPIHSKEDWEARKEKLYNNAEKFAQAVESMSNHQLNEVFVDEKYGTYHRNIDGMIEHAYYHLGQVSLIRKLITEQVNV
jgi:hypothetical protein